MTRRYRRRYRRPLSWRRTRRWWRRRTRRERQVLAVVAIAVVFAAIGQHEAVKSPQSDSPAQAASAPGPGPYTPASWAAAFLGAIPEPQTSCNIAAVVAWENAEGGAWTNNAQDNPLDTTQPEPGSWSVNSANVQGFPSWAEGLQANVTVIETGRYGSILLALQAGNNAQAVADAVASSPWGTQWFLASC